jgi:hypothetical protein
LHVIKLTQAGTRHPHVLLASDLILDLAGHHFTLNVLN